MKVIFDSHLDKPPRSICDCCDDISCNMQLKSVPENKIFFLTILLYHNSYEFQNKESIKETIIRMSVKTGSNSILSSMSLVSLHVLQFVKWVILHLNS